MFTRLSNSWKEGLELEQIDQKHKNDNGNGNGNDDDNDNDGVNNNNNNNNNESFKPVAKEDDDDDDDEDNQENNGGGGEEEVIHKNGINSNHISTAKDIIRLRNIHKTYLLGVEGVPALRGVSLNIKEGEFIVILGKSGGGKTSMLNIMGTIDKPTKGDLYICGKRVSSASTDSELADIRLKKIGFCFQTFNLISSMTALENVELPMILNGTLSSNAIRERARSLLTHFGLSKRFDHLPSQLSGGEQQRVTIARAIANRPSLLLLDEPTGDLDTKNSHIVLNILVELNRRDRITCIFVTHDISLKNFAHRVVHMLDGKIARIEEVPEEKRSQAERDLKNAVEKSADIGVDEHTEIREPGNFYSYQQWLQKHKKSAVKSSTDEEQKQH